MKIVIDKGNRTLVFEGTEGKFKITPIEWVGVDDHMDFFGGHNNYKISVDFLADEVEFK